MGGVSCGIVKVKCALCEYEVEKKEIGSPVFVFFSKLFLCNRRWWLCNFSGSSWALIMQEYIKLKSRIDTLS